jgi:hypothetical protein
MEMNIGDDRHFYLAHDVLERQRRILVGARDAHDIRTGAFQRLDLLDRRLDVARDRVRHRLHGDRRIAADRHIADINLAASTAVNITIRANAHLILAGFFFLAL